MNELDFKTWLTEKGISRKVQSDLVSRIKKIERVCGNCDIDEEYNRDGCIFLLSIFRNKGINAEMNQFYKNNLPIGKYHLSAYKYAIQKYIIYRKLNSTSE